MSEKQRLQTANTEFNDVLLKMIDELEEQASPEGEYVWRKKLIVNAEQVSYSPITIKLSSNVIDFSKVDTSYFDGWIIARDSAGFVTLYGDGTCTYTGSSGDVTAYTYTYDASTQIITTTRSITSSDTWHCIIPFDTESYIVSNYTTAYPDYGFGDDGYWYEKVAASGIAYGKFALGAASVSITVEHNLNVVPTWAALIPEKLLIENKRSVLQVENYVLYTNSSTSVADVGGCVKTEKDIQFSAPYQLFKVQNYYWIAIA